jgi:hypothetical protein
MATRFNSRSSSRFNVPGLSSGYDGISAGNLTVPCIGLEDVDEALFNLFDKEIRPQVGGDGKSNVNVPVMFACGERWSMIKNNRALRDRNGSLILPLITMIRTSVVQDPVQDIAGRGINQQTGEFVIRRRLSSSDRTYQNLINRTLIPHQSNLAVSEGEGDQSQLTTSRTIGDLSEDPTVEDGGLLLLDRRRNVYETISIPTPQFYTATYEVTVWTQKLLHMNQVIEQLISSFLPQGNSWRLDTKKGYWFIASVEDNSFNAENNADDMSTDERTIMTKFVVKVPSYILATSVPGAPVPLKRSVSAPFITFDISTGDTGEGKIDGYVEEPFIGSDDPTLPVAGSTLRRDGRSVGETQLYPSRGVVAQHDPARANVPRGHSLKRYKKIVRTDSSGKKTTKYIRIASMNSYVGETVYSSDVDLGDLQLLTVEDDAEV